MNDIVKNVKNILVDKLKMSVTTKCIGSDTTNELKPNGIGKIILFDKKLDGSGGEIIIYLHTIGTNLVSYILFFKIFFAF